MDADAGSVISGSGDSSISKRSSMRARTGILRSMLGKGDVEQDGREVSTEELKRMVQQHEEMLQRIEQDRDREYRELKTMVAATATEIQSFKEMNDAMFKKITELSTAVQVEYDQLTKTLESIRAASSAATATTGPGTHGAGPVGSIGGTMSLSGGSF